MNFTLSKRTSLSFSSVFRFSDGDNYSTIIYEDFDLSDVLSQTVTRDELEVDFGRNQEYTLSFRKTVPQKGRLWTLDVKKNFAIGNEQSHLFENSTDLLDVPIFQRTINDEKENSWLFQTDYTITKSKLVQRTIWT